MFITTQQGFFIRTRLHRVCHPHHKVFSSALVRTVAQVEKHCTIVNKPNDSSRGKNKFS